MNARTSSQNKDTSEELAKKSGVAAQNQVPLRSPLNPEAVCPARPEDRTKTITQFQLQAKLDSQADMKVIPFQPIRPNPTEVSEQCRRKPPENERKGLNAAKDLPRTNAHINGPSMTLLASELVWRKAPQKIVTRQLLVNNLLDHISGSNPPQRELLIGFVL
jgi:hypothetical protein